MADRETKTAAQSSLDGGSEHEIGAAQLSRPGGRLLALLLLAVENERDVYHFSGSCADQQKNLPSGQVSRRVSCHCNEIAQTIDLAEASSS
jgi:hypothetical protein